MTHNASISRQLVADWQALLRIFISPDSDAGRTTLVKYMEQILFGLHDFLKKNVGITEEISLKLLAARFTDTRISHNPEKRLADVITDLIKDIAPHAVNVASPYFIGHMTSAIPFFMVHLKTIVAALNQNVVKIETSKVVSVIEKQVLAKIHRLIYHFDDAFYLANVQNAHTCLGAFIEGGTAANMTALWVARNRAFGPTDDFGGIEKEGFHAACMAHGVERGVVLVSRRGHYSIRKAAGVLGIGNQNVIPIDINGDNRIDIRHLRRTIHELRSDPKNRIIAVIGVAGTTETGSVDPLRTIGEICAENRLYFHADAAWGGPTLMSEKYRHLLDGIETADSVTIDGHKQFYMPMSCGMVYFKDPTIMDVIEYHAKYVIRRGSVDLGMKSIAGSREANCLILDSALKIMGASGYALLIEHGIETTAGFAEEIRRRSNFELISSPELNILTYRLCPPDIQYVLRRCDEQTRRDINRELNEMNRLVQILQREAGNSFVSRTSLSLTNMPEDEMVVLRSVLMNPMTDIQILNEILDEQEIIFLDRFGSVDWSKWLKPRYPLPVG